MSEDPVETSKLQSIRLAIKAINFLMVLMVVWVIVSVANAVAKSCAPCVCTYGQAERAP